MAKRALKFGNVILCEYAAKGERNKYTLVNVFAGDVLVDEMPAKLSFGIYIEHLAETLEPLKVVLDLKLDDVVFGRVEVMTRPHKLGTPGAIVLPTVEMGVERDLTFTIEASADGYDRAMVLSKRIYLNPVATSSSAQPPPS